MQFTDKKELASLSHKDLHKELYATQKHLANLQFSAKQGNLKDTSQLRKTRQHHARLAAVKRQREREEILKQKAERRAAAEKPVAEAQKAV